MAPHDTLRNNYESGQTDELPVHCARCGRDVTLFLDLNLAISAFNRPSLERPRPWLCVWCGAENSIGVDGHIGAVVRGHATDSFPTVTPDSPTRHGIMSPSKPFTVTVPLFCQHCGKSMLLTISRGALGDDRDEVDPLTQPQRWACAWCRMHNDRVCFGWLVEVRKNEP